MATEHAEPKNEIEHDQNLHDLICLRRIATDIPTRRDMGKSIWRERRRVKREAKHRRLLLACENNRCPQESLRSCHFNWEKAFGKNGNASEQLTKYFAEIYELTGTEKEQENGTRAQYIDSWKNLRENGAQPAKIDRPMVERAIARLKNGKNSSDGLTAEILKKLDTANLDLLAQQIEEMFAKCEFHSNWAAITATLVPKIACPKGPKDFRPIASLVTLRKLMGYIFLQALPQQNFTTLQCGFVAKRDAAQAVFTVRHLSEHAREWQVPLHIAQLDMSKAFDRVKHSAILQALEARGTPAQLTAYLAEMLRESTVTLSLSSSKTRTIALDRGVPQGAPESPQLFISVTDHILGKLFERWKSKNWGYRANDAWIPIVAYADDIIVLAKSLSELQQMLGDISAAFETAGLSINPEKTRYSSSCGGDGNEAPLLFDGATVPWRQTFEFLGSRISPGGNDEKGIFHRLMKAKETYQKWKPVLECTGIPESTRLSAFNCSVMASLSWCSQTWTPTEKQYAKLQSFCSRCGASMKRIRRGDAECIQQWWRRLHREGKKFLEQNQKKKKRLDLNPTRVIKKDKIRFAGHIARLPSEDPVRQVLAAHSLEKWRETQRLSAGSSHARGAGKSPHPARFNALRRWEAMLEEKMGAAWAARAQSREEWKRATEAFSSSRARGLRPPRLPIHAFSQAGVALSSVYARSSFLRVFR